MKSPTNRLLFIKIIIVKIYTKGGDRGTTSLLSGRIVPKHHIRIEAYGTVDELMAFTGLLRDSYHEDHFSHILLEIQDRLMTITSLLAADDKSLYNSLPRLAESDVEVLEKEIDRMDEALPPLRSFILPGGHQTASFCHIARTICRRAERIVIKLSEESEVDPLIIKYLNRLSDFFFMLSRLISSNLNIKETVWKPKL